MWGRGYGCVCGGGGGAETIQTERPQTRAHRLMVAIPEEIVSTEDT